MSRLGEVKRHEWYLRLSTPKLVNGFKECGGVPFCGGSNYGILIVKIILVL